MTFAASVRAVALFLGVGTAYAQFTGTGSISGRVLNAATSEPIRKASVTLHLNSPRDASAIAITNANGDFRFDNLPVGTYRLFAGKYGFQGLAFGTRSIAQAGTFVTLSDAEARTDLVFNLPPTTAIAGRVSDSDGEPLKGVPMAVYRKVYRRGKPELVQFNQATTDDRGTYRIFNLMSARYYLKATPPLRPQWGSYATNESQQVLAAEFYADASDEDQAKVLDLRKGGEMNDIDFHLRALIGGSIKGRVVMPDAGQPHERIHPSIDIQSTDSQRQFGTGIDQNGEFQFRGVPPGTYIISATIGRPNMSGPNVAQIHSAEVQVQQGQEVEVTLTPKPLIELRCAVKIEGPGSEKYNQFNVTLLSAVRNRPQIGTIWRRDGECKLSNISPGIWDIGVNPLPPELYLKAMTLGGKDVLNEEMNLQSNVSDVLTIVLSTIAATVSGEVKRQSKEQVLPAVILLAPAVHSMGTLSLYRTRFTDAEGKFSFGGMPPGDYRLFAFEELEPGSWEAFDFLKPFAASGVPVRLTEQQKSSVELTRIPAQQGAQQ